MKSGEEEIEEQGARRIDTEYGQIDEINGDVRLQKMIPGMRRRGK